MKENLEDFLFLGGVVFYLMYLGTALVYFLDGVAVAVITGAALVLTALTVGTALSIGLVVYLCYCAVYEAMQFTKKIKRKRLETCGNT
ncbi:MAG: hypothetical protein ACPGPF_00010 [Pontibacterium sp.]